MLRRLAQTQATSLHRLYTTGRTEGSVAQSQGFNKREKAAEDKYVKEHERMQLKKLQAAIEAKKAELASLEQEAENVEKATKK